MYDLIVVGGGPAGLAAACKAWDEGVKNILVLERDKELGGILNQCIHNGFGLQRFKEEAKALRASQHRGAAAVAAQASGAGQHPCPAAS